MRCALRQIRARSQGFSPEPDGSENPFFCLLQSDGLINEVRVETDRLLAPLASGDAENDVELIIHVIDSRSEREEMLRQTFTYNGQHEQRRCMDRIYRLWGCDGVLGGYSRTPEADRAENR